MNTYEKLLQLAKDEEVAVCECFDLNGTTENKIRGLYMDGNIALDMTLETTAEKASILAEELGHYYTSYGNIIDLVDIRNMKQEHRARIWAYDRQIGLIGIIQAYEHGCTDLHDMSDYLDVPECFLLDALSYYKSKYGIYTMLDRYIIYFIPCVLVSLKVRFKL